MGVPQSLDRPGLLGEAWKGDAGWGKWGAELGALVMFPAICYGGRVYAEALTCP